MSRWLKDVRENTESERTGTQALGRSLKDMFKERKEDSVATVQ